MNVDDMQQVLRQEAAAVLNIPVGEHFNHAIDLIYKQVHQHKGKLVTSGMGKAGQIALNMATTFCSTGTPSIFLHPSEAQHGDLGVLQDNDVMLLISNSGKTREIVELVTLTRNLVSANAVYNHHKQPRIAIGRKLPMRCCLPEIRKKCVCWDLLPTTSTYGNDRNRRCAGGGYDAQNRLYACRL